jgi:hypothetical protein
MTTNHANNVTSLMKEWTALAVGAAGSGSGWGSETDAERVVTLYREYVALLARLIPAWEAHVHLFGDVGLSPAQANQLRAHRDLHAELMRRVTLPTLRVDLTPLNAFAADLLARGDDPMDGRHSGAPESFWPPPPSTPVTPRPSASPSRGGSVASSFSSYARE